VANTETRVPVREDSLFQAASLSKPVFAYVVLQLADQKLLDLDRPLVQYHRPSYLSNHPDLELVTARDVLRHTTGLPNWRERPEERLSPAFKPGTRYRYTGEGYFWLQLVVEQLTGESVATVMQSRLLKPAKMTGSTFGWSVDHARRAVDGHYGRGNDEGKVAFSSRRAMGDRYLAVAARWGKPFDTWSYPDLVRAIPEALAAPGSPPLPEGLTKTPIGKLELPDRLFPNMAGSLLTTAAEYARFMALIMDHPKSAFWEIDRATRQAMLSTQGAVRAGVFSRGLGWGLEQTPAGLLFEHSGNNGGIYKAFAVGDPIRRRGIVILTNGGTGDRIYDRIVRAATGYDLLGFI
jgi:CubicO group peptidase (beta-lactamase class C family)